MSPLLDAPDRRLAATCFDRNLVVVAGAGTGKTSLLVERFLNLVLSGRVNLEGIAAITFTDKAAAEMRTRVVAALDAVARGGELPPGGEAQRSVAWLTQEEGVEPARLQERARSAVNAVESAFIGTIHSFCADLLRRYPLEAGIPSDPAVDAGAAQDLLFETLWPEFLSEELGPRPEREALWLRVLAVFTEEEIEEIARALVRSPASCDHLAHDGAPLRDEREAFGDLVRDLQARLTADLGEVTSETLTGQIGTLLDLLTAFLEGGTDRLRAREREIPVEDSFWKKTESYSAGRGVKRNPEIQATVVATHRLLRDLRRSTDAAFVPLLEGLRPFAARFRERVLRDGTLAFDDLLLLARNLLRDHPEVRGRESARTPAILIDEFQDTDPLQYEIVFLLAAAAGSAIDDPYAVPLEAGRLFIVGDPKQSIYRFRGADLSAFLRARERVLDGALPATLSTNFRSVDEVLSPLNGLFESWMGPALEDREVEPPYEPIHAHQGKVGSGPCIEIWSVGPAGTKAEERRAAEARAIAAEIAERLLPAGVPAREIGILLRALTDLPVLARALREADVDFVVDGGRSFFQRAEIVEGLALLQAVGNPADPVALLGALRSSWGGVPDAELLRYARDGGKFSRDGSPPRGMERYPAMLRALERLHVLEAKRLEEPLDRWIRRVLTEGDVPLLAAAHADGPQRVANLHKLAERAAALTLEGGFALEATVRTLEAEFSGDRVEGESPLADEALDAVRILSIHKAKGLEYRVVFVPDVGRMPPPPGLPRTRVGLTRAGGRPAVAVESARGERLQNTAATLACREDRRHERAETKRLLYVAATRAKARLVFVNSLTQRPGPWLKALGDRWGYSVRQWPEDGAVLGGGDVLHRHFPAERKSRRPAPDPGGIETAAVEAGRRAMAAAGAPRPPALRNPSRDPRVLLEAAASDEPIRPLAPRDRDLARAAGVAVHRLLETGSFAPDATAWTEPAGRESARAAAELGVDAAALRREVEGIVRAFLASPLRERLSRAEVLGREIPVLRRDAEGATVFGYLDLLYRLDGAIHVADYKTDPEDSPAQAERYRGQLEDYAAAVRDALGLEALPVMEVLFLRTGSRVPLGGGTR